MVSVVGRVRPALLWWGLPPVAAAFFVLRADTTVTMAFAASQVLFLLVVWLSAAATRSAWATETTSAGRRTWGFLTAACASVAVGNTVLSVYQVFVDAQGPSGFSLVDALNVVAIAAFIAALISMYAVSQQSRLVTVRRVIDVAGLAAVAYAGINVLVWTLAQGLPSAIVNTALEALYSLAGMVILGAAILSALGLASDESGSWGRTLVAGLGLYGATIMLWPVWYVFLRAAGVQWIEVAVATLFLCCYYIIFVAGSYHAATSWRTRSETGAMMSTALERRGIRSIVPPTVLLVAIPLLGVSAVRMPEGSPVATVNLAVMVFAGTVLVMRTGIDALESGGLRRRAATDPLTGLPDVRTMTARLSDSVRFYERYGQPVSVIVVDLLDLGRLNVLYGREEGDRILKEFADTLSAAATDDTETVGRLGSDEFLVILDGAGPDRALSRAEELRSAVSDVRAPTGLPVTATWGAASCPRDSTRHRDLVTKAYAAQQWAHTHGILSVVPYAPETVDVFDAVSRATTAEEQAELDMLLAVAFASEHRHPATRYHSRNVAALAVRVAERLALPPPLVRDVEIAALLHDIGKTSLPDEILTKRGPRTRVEEACYREHVLIGARIVEASGLRRVASAIRGHHERWDGSGYPDGLSGTGIPVAARVIAACDAFECMVAGRPDRHSLSVAAALQELDQNLGIAYDPDVVEALLAVCADTPIDEGVFRGEAQ